MTRLVMLLLGCLYSAYVFHMVILFVYRYTLLYCHITYVGTYTYGYTWKCTYVYISARMLLYAYMVVAAWLYIGMVVYGCMVIWLYV